MIHVILPYHLRALANVSREVVLEVQSPPTYRALLDALEAEYPALRGTIRDYATQQRRPFIRFFASGQDWSLEPPEALLPAEVAEGKEPFRIVGAMAGG